MGTINAANEIAVEKFLNKKIGFLDIAKIIEKTLENATHFYPKSLDDVIGNDQKSRLIATEIALSYA